MRGCCGRSVSTAPRPTSTPTCPHTTTSILSTATSWSTFPIHTFRFPDCRTYRKAMRSRASIWWYGCARSAEPLSIHHLVGVDAPQLLLLDPAVKAPALNVAPAGVARLHRGQHAVLQACHHRARRIIALMEQGEIILVLHHDDSGAAA